MPLNARQIDGVKSFDDSGVIAPTIPDAVSIPECNKRA